MLRYGVSYHQARVSDLVLVGPDGELVEGEGVEVPAQQGQNGKIVLNISPQAVEGLMLGNDAIGFRARFGGISTDVYVPLDSVLAIYAKENGRGMVFNEDDGEPEPEGTGGSRPGKRPALKIVK